MSPIALLIGLMVGAVVLLIGVEGGLIFLPPGRWRRLIARSTDWPADGRGWSAKARRVSQRLFPDDGHKALLAGLDGSATGRLPGTRMALGIAGASVGALVSLAGRRPAWLFVIGLALAGAWLPSVLLDSKAKRRQSRIRREFPGIVDLLALCARAGLNLDRALEVAARLTKGELARELGRALKELYVGRRPIAALRNLCDRVPLPEVEALVTALAQAETLGTPVGDLLATQASVARNLFRQQIEATVGRLPVLLTVCTLVFLFPALFVLVLLPNILTFMGSHW